jgi:CheY-like chemotaxis protein
MPQTLLIVDDDSEMRELLRHILSLRGFHVLTAPSGRAALALALTTVVSAALVDINMPGMNGIEFCRALHAQDSVSGRQTPIWIMTGAYREGMMEAARAAGAQTVLGKPLKVAELCKRFERALQIHFGKAAPSAVPA